MAHCKPTLPEKQNLLSGIFQILPHELSSYTAQHHANNIGGLLVQWIMQACHIARLSVRGNVCLNKKEKIFLLLAGNKWRSCVRKALPERFVNEARGSYTCSLLWDKNRAKQFMDCGLNKNTCQLFMVFVFWISQFKISWDFCNSLICSFRYVTLESARVYTFLSILLFVAIRSCLLAWLLYEWPGWPWWASTEVIWNATKNLLLFRNTPWQVYSTYASTNGSWSWHWYKNCSQKNCCKEIKDKSSTPLHTIAIC